MEAQEIIRAAILGAGDEICQHILWGRTPFPFAVVTAQALYKAASGFHRANTNGIQLCDHCHNPAMENKWMCKQCAGALASVRK